MAPRELHALLAAKMLLPVGVMIATTHRATRERWLTGALAATHD
jgi:hypothetical protein